MNKTLLIWRRTYRRSVLHPAFLLFTFGLPAVYVVAAAIAAYFIVKAAEGDQRPIGYVDESGALIAAEAWQPGNPDERVVEMLRFDSEGEAGNALRAGTIQAYYVVAPDYMASGSVTEVSAGNVADRVRDQARAFLREGLLRSTPAAHRVRIALGARVLHRSLDDQREMIFQLALQWGAAAAVISAFYLTNLTTSSDMLHVLNEETWGGTIEIALTSATPAQLLAGKIGGVVSAGLTQFAVWALGAGAPTLVALRLLALGGIELSFAPLWATLALCLALLLPAYVVNSATIAIVTSITDLAGRGEQIVSLVMSFGGVIIGPLTLIAVSAPDNSLAVALSLFPFTSATVMVARFVQVEVPAWQIALAVGLAWGWMIFSVFAAARLYRAAWLMAGQGHWLKSAWLAMIGK